MFGVISQDYNSAYHHSKYNNMALIMDLPLSRQYSHWKRVMTKLLKPNLHENGSIFRPGNILIMHSQLAADMEPIESRGGKLLCSFVVFV